MGDLKNTTDRSKVKYEYPEGEKQGVAESYQTDLGLVGYMD